MHKIFLERYTGEKTYIMPSGRIATKDEVLKQFPSALMVPWVVGTTADRTIMHSMDMLQVLRINYHVPNDLDEEHAIDFIQDQMNLPDDQEVDRVFSDIDRLTAAIELQTLLNM